MNGRYIIPLNLGEHASEKSLFYLRRYIGEMALGGYVAAYIGGARKRIVVDKGPPGLERILKYHPYVRPEPHRPEQEMEVQLSKTGVKPEEIDIIVLTHLHWDHVGQQVSKRRVYCVPGGVEVCLGSASLSLWGL